MDKLSVYNMQLMQSLIISEKLALLQEFSESYLSEIKKLQSQALYQNVYFLENVGGFKYD